MNCLEEFKEHIKDVNKPVLCAHLIIINTTTWVLGADNERIKSWWDEYPIYIKKGFQESDLDVLNFNYYEDGYRDNGELYLSGTIWFTDGTWSKRDCSEYFEYWDHISRPEIPKELEA